MRSQVFIYRGSEFRTETHFGDEINECLISSPHLSTGWVCPQTLSCWRRCIPVSVLFASKLPSHSAIWTGDSTWQTVLSATAGDSGNNDRLDWPWVEWLCRLSSPTSDGLSRDDSVSSWLIWLAEEREQGGIKKTRNIVPLLPERHAGSSRKQIRQGTLGGVPLEKYITVVCLRTAREEFFSVVRRCI